MLVVCVNNSYSKLTIGKKYFVTSQSASDIDEFSQFYDIIDDGGLIGSYSSIRFKPISELRFNKLKKI